MKRLHRLFTSATRIVALIILFLMSIHLEQIDEDLKNILASTFTTDKDPAFQPWYWCGGHACVVPDDPQDSDRTPASAGKPLAPFSCGLNGQIWAPEDNGFCYLRDMPKAAQP